MPIYGFACTHCGHRFDRLQKVNDPDPQVCPTCEHATVHRQLSAPAVRLAGKGWYETDFKPADQQRNVIRPETPSKQETSA